MGFMDDNGLRHLWLKIKALFNKGITNLSVNGKVITFTKGDGTTGTITTQDTNTTYSVMKGATASAAGSSGLVPAPPANAQDKFLKGDGTFGTPVGTTYDDFTGATGSAAGTNGLVPAPASGQHAKFLRGDGNWSTPANTTYDDFTGATESAEGSSGLVPAPALGRGDSLLWGDGTWEDLELTGEYSREENPSTGIDLHLRRGSWLLSSFPIKMASDNGHGLMSYTDKAKLDGFGEASTYAKKSEISGIYKYKGSVTDAAKLPTSGQAEGDVYNIDAASSYGPAGTNVAWTGSAWDSLGGVFEIVAISNADIDKICV